MENRNIIYYEQLDSTNTQIDRLAAKGANHGTVVIAKAQSAGKGRRGRSWESPAGENLYMSILLRPQMETEKAPMLTLVMAYSVLKAIQKQGFDMARIKWPNDIVISGKKVCGILTEMHLAGSDIDYVVIGIGVNVNTKEFSPELSDKATSLYLEDGCARQPQMIAVDILDSFWHEYERFMEKKDLTFIQEEYNAMLVNREREVKVLEPEQEYQAQALGINNAGELIVRLENGEERTVYAGEVSVRGVYGYV